MLEAWKQTIPKLKYPPYLFSSQMGNENVYKVSADGGDSHSPQPATALDLDKNTIFMSNYHHQNRHYHLPQPSEVGGIYNPNNTSNQIASGVSMKSTAASGRLLFTETQWQELERQTMIFKYMMASIPVPPELLLSTQSNRGLKFSNGSDPEPWRCKRTDGKKWRCAKDVSAPDQKYCERHAHKSRPRSRKPVEIQSHNPSSHLNNPTANQQTRCTDWFMKSDNNGQFQQSKRDQIFKVNSYLDHTIAASDAAAGARREHFIDSWSRIGNGDDCSLTLSMQSGGNNDNFQMLDGNKKDNFGEVNHNHNHHQWLNWADSTPGGPLGEALCLGIANSTTTSDGYGHGLIR